MGEGVYRFGTRRGEDAEIYALLDKYITEVCFLLAREGKSNACIIRLL